MSNTIKLAKGPLKIVLLDKAQIPENHSRQRNNGTIFRPLVHVFVQDRKGDKPQRVISGMRVKLAQAELIYTPGTEIPDWAPRFAKGEQAWFQTTDEVEVILKD